MERRRGSARSRGYSSAWDKASKGFLRSNPVCEYCQLEGRARPATLTDHLYPHREHDGVFWLKEFWVASCASCHSGFKQGIEAKGTEAIDRLARQLGRPRLKDFRP